MLSVRLLFNRCLVVKFLESQNYIQIFNCTGVRGFGTRNPYTVENSAVCVFKLLGSVTSLKKVDFYSSGNLPGWTQTQKSLVMGSNQKTLPAFQPLLFMVCLHMYVVQMSAKDLRENLILDFRVSPSGSGNVLLLFS